MTEQEFDLMIAPKKSTTRCARKVSEVSMQATAFKNLWASRPDLRGRLYTVNNNSHNKITGALNKSMGVLKSVADQCFLIQGGLSVYIEWKTDTGPQSKGQKEWQAMVTALGHTYVVVRNEEEFLQIINKYE